MPQSLINTEYFNGTQVYIANGEDSNLSINLAEFIELEESRFLTDLLGYTLYKNMIPKVDYNVDPPTATAPYDKLLNGGEFTDQCGNPNYWFGLLGQLNGIDMKFSQIANYVYWNWMRQHASHSTSVGETFGQDEIGIPTSPIAKQVKAWNEMVDWNHIFHQFMVANASDFPDYIGLKFPSYPSLSCGCKRSTRLFIKQTVYNF